MVIFNGTDRLIEITDPSDFSLDAEKDIYSAWKDWIREDDNNSKYPYALRTFGGDPTITNQYAPKYFFLQNYWRVFVNNGNVVSVGINLYTDDYTTPYVVGSGSGISDRNSDAVSVNDALIQQSSFNNRVAIDQYNSTSRAYPGISFPTGTYSRPSDNTVDTKSIAVERGFEELYVIGALDLDSASEFIKYSFLGESPLKTTISIEEDANIFNCEFYDAHLDGYLDGNSQINRCVVDNLFFVDGFVINSSLGPGTITLGTYTIANFFGCFSTIPGTETPIINGNGSGILALRDYNGGIKLINFTDNSTSHSIDLSSGQVIFDSASVTAGRFVVRGVGKLVDENGNNIPTGTWNGGVTIVNELLTASQIVGSSSPWTETEKQESLAYGRKASDNAKQANEKL